MNRYLFKVYINGDFRGVIAASCHDNAVSVVRRTYITINTDAVEVIRFTKVA